MKMCRQWGSVLLLAVSMVFWGQGMYLYSKAWLAQRFIASAWQQSIDTGAEVKPWHWADTWPVARLRSNHLDQDLFVLAGSDGSSLAFGPGHLFGTELPGQGSSVVAGHRDTHFRFLADLSLGEHLQVQSQTGAWAEYQVIETRVDDIREGPLWVQQGGEQLVLVTCYPFDALVPGGPLRYVVTAEPLAF